jgi:hypothetical protein
MSRRRGFAQLPLWAIQEVSLAEPVAPFINEGYDAVAAP